MNSQMLQYKIARDPDEFQQIYSLNYQTFVEEIPQHEINDSRMLKDRFHDENTYVIAKAGDEVVGMIAVRSDRPFSLDQKLGNLDEYLPPHSVLCEIRLLSVKETYRSTRVFYQLCEVLLSHCLEKGYTMALISGTVRQLKLYKRMGFRPFAELVGKDAARFQPMYLTRESFENSTKAFRRLMVRKSEETLPHVFLPGPVPRHKRVEDAFKKEAISHRSSLFLQEMEEVRKNLRKMTSANHVQVAVGTGTLANDMVAAQLTKLSGRGLILANGEFGYRLMDHGNRFDLSFHTIEKEWNDRITLDEIETVLQCDPGIKWLWTVHCETSTGYLYKIGKLLSLCQKYDVELCVDACSSVGAIPIDLKNVYLASSVSGKALGSYPGLALIFHRDKINPSDSIPRYLDVGMYATNGGSVPFTHSSNLLGALNEALQVVDYEKNLIISQKVRRLLKQEGLHLLEGESYAPWVITLALNRELCSRQFGDVCKGAGILLSYESKYLINRNWVQVALMGSQNEWKVLNAMSVLTREFQSMRDPKVIQ